MEAQTSPQCFRKLAYMPRVLFSPRLPEHVQGLLRLWPIQISATSCLSTCTASDCSRIFMMLVTQAAFGEAPPTPNHSRLCQYGGAPSKFLPIKMIASFECPPKRGEKRLHLWHKWMKARPLWPDSLPTRTLLDVCPPLVPLSPHVIFFRWRRFQRGLQL